MYLISPRNEITFKRPLSLCRPLNLERISTPIYVVVSRVQFTQWEKSPIKQFEGVCFVNSALKIPCHIVKNTLLQTAFLAILSTGYPLVVYIDIL